MIDNIDFTTIGGVGLKSILEEIVSSSDRKRTSQETIVIDYMRWSSMQWDTRSGEGRAYNAARDVLLVARLVAVLSLVLCTMRSRSQNKLRIEKTNTKTHFLISSCPCPSPASSSFSRFSRLRLLRQPHQRARTTSNQNQTQNAISSRDLNVNKNTQHLDMQALQRIANLVSVQFLSETNNQCTHKTR